MSLVALKHYIVVYELTELVDKMWINYIKSYFIGCGIIVKNEPIYFLGYGLAVL